MRSKTAVSLAVRFYRPVAAPKNFAKGTLVQALPKSYELPWLQPGVDGTKEPGFSPTVSTLLRRPFLGQDMSMTIAFANTDAEIQRCYEVMSQLRPHIEREDFLPRVRRQMDSFGFRLTYIKDDDEVKAVAGIRVSEWLHGGKYLEIDDLVAKDGDRSKGYGGQLFDWIVDLARKESCNQVRLLSGVQRFDAHRFYLKKRMNIEAHYFNLQL